MMHIKDPLLLIKRSSLSRYLNGHLPYIQCHITVLNQTFPSFHPLIPIYQVRSYSFCTNRSNCLCVFAQQNYFHMCKNLLPSSNVHIVNLFFTQCEYPTKIILCYNMNICIEMFNCPLMFCKIYIDWIVRQTSIVQCQPLDYI